MAKLKVPKPAKIKPTRGIRRILERDPAQRILDQLELVQPKLSMKLLRRVTKQTKARVRGGWIHVTDAAIPCDRILAGALLGVSPPRSFIMPNTRRIFDNGTFMHLRYQCYFLCLPKPFVVDAPKLLRQWPIIGEADIRVQHPEIGKWVIELKTMNTGQWRGLSVPLASHVEQVNGYEGMSGSDWGAQLWYENKNDQKLKLYTRGFDKPAWEKVWLRTSMIASDVLAGRLPGRCPTCPDVEFCEDKICLSEKAMEVIHEQRALSYPRRR